MNVQLTKMVENTSVASFVPKKVTDFKHKPVEEKEKVISRELFNNEKILENLVEEFQKLKGRLDSIKDPGYLINIDDQIEELKRKTEKIRKANVKLNVATAVAGREIHDIESEGIHPQVKETNQKGQELFIINKKLDKLRAENELIEEQKAKKNERLDELQEKLDKLTAIASHMKIAVPNPQRIEKHANLKQKVTDLENGIKFLENNNDKYIKNHLQKEVDELSLIYNRDKEHITLLEQMLAQQKNALKEMLEKENMKDKNDKATKELISKIKLTLEEADTTFEFDNRLGEGPTTTTNAEDRKGRAGKPPIGKDPRKDLYDGLPLYSPTKLKQEASKKIPAKKDFPDIREKTPEVAVREERISIKKVEKKPAENPNPKPLSRPSSHKELSKEPVKQQPAKEKEKEKEPEEKPKEDGNPAFSKPNIFKKPFSKKVEDSVNLDDQMKKEESAPVLTNKPDGNKLEPATNLGINKKDNGLSLPDFMQDTKKSPEITKKNELKISDDLGAKKNTNDLTMPNKTPGEGAGKLITDIPVDESINLGGVSRVRGGRQRGAEQQQQAQQPKKDDLWGSTDTKPLEIKAEPKKDTKPINDPFAKFDNLDSIDFSKKDKNLLGSQEQKAQPVKKNNDDFDNMGLFNPVEEKKPVVQQKKEPGLFGDDDDRKIQVRKGPRDRGVGLGGGAQNKENIDDLFGGGTGLGGVVDSQKENPISLESKPARRNMFDDKKKDDDLFGDDLFTKKTTIEPKKEQLSLGNDFGAKNLDFGKKDTGFNNNLKDLTDITKDEKPVQKPAEKFSMAPTDNLGGIGGKPRRMNMGGAGPTNTNNQKVIFC